MRVRLTEDLIGLLRDKRVFFENNRKLHRLQPGQTLSFADDCEVEPYCAVLNGYAVPNIGCFSYSWSPVQPELSIGRYCSIARGLSLPAPRHPLESISTSLFTYDKSCSIVTSFLDDEKIDGYTSFIGNPQKPFPVIHNDVWIGANVTLMPGISLGNGSVIAAGSVVTKDVADYAVVGGNPAKLIRYRFPEPLVGKFQQLQWWRFKFSDFAGLSITIPEQFIDEIAAKDLTPFEPPKIRLRDLLARAAPGRAAPMT
jgi:acetyltransferase-like isoleucine patch superfamily enzyme